MPMHLLVFCTNTHPLQQDRKSTRLNSSHLGISYAVFCLKKKSDFAVGLSRQLHGLTIASERALHRLMEQWHPLGAVGIVTAFNFLVAVWSCNAGLAAVCGDVCLWKPSPLTPLCGAAVQALCDRVSEEHGAQGVFTLVPGGVEAGTWLCDDPRVPLVW